MPGAPLPVVMASLLEGRGRTGAGANAEITRDGASTFHLRRPTPERSRLLGGHSCQSLLSMNTYR